MLALSRVVPPARCEVKSQAPWRRIACSYEAPVEILPRLSWIARFRIDVEEPYLTPRQE